jgi:hypothetical protein
MGVMYREDANRTALAIGRHKAALGVMRPGSVCTKSSTTQVTGSSCGHPLASRCVRARRSAITLREDKNRSAFV